MRKRRRRKRRRRRRRSRGRKKKMFCWGLHETLQEHWPVRGWYGSRGFFGTWKKAYLDLLSPTPVTSRNLLYFKISTENKQKLIVGSNCVVREGQLHVDTLVSVVQCFSVFFLESGMVKKIKNKNNTHTYAYTHAHLHTLTHTPLSSKLITSDQWHQGDSDLEM